MANGQLKVIKDIVVGERVLGQDGTHNVVTGIGGRHSSYCQKLVTQVSGGAFD